MKISCFSGVLAGILLLAGTSQAADLENELRTLREDVMVLQRQVYRGTEKENKATSAENAGVQVKIGEYDEAIRKINGRLDELEYKVKQSNDKVDKLNRDIEIRMKILEGRPIPANLSAPAPTLPTTYDAKVANKASRAVVGDKIHGDDLAPIDGAPQPIVPDNIAEPSAGTPPPPPANTINANKPEDMYSNAMQAYNSGFYDEAELAFGDLPIFLTCAHCGLVHAMTDVMAVYRKHPTGLSTIFNTNNKTVLRFADDNLKLYRIFGRQYKDICTNIYVMDYVNYFLKARQKGQYHFGILMKVLFRHPFLTLNILKTRYNNSKYRL